MVSEKQIEAAAKMLSRFIDLSGHTEDWVSYAVGAALTAAEQAEPAPAARSGAVKVKPEAFLVERLSGTGYGKPRSVVDAAKYDPRRDEFWVAGAKDKHRITPLYALEPAEPATDAEPVATVYRRGNVTGQLVWTKAGERADLPDGTNLYTRPLEQATDAEPAAWTNRLSEPSQIRPRETPEFDTPLFTRPPESQLREALEWYAEQARLCRLIHSGGDAGRNALAKDGGAKARAALAQEDGR